MPIVDVQIVCERSSQPGPTVSQALADTLGSVFGSQPGRTWVRVHFLGAEHYAENGVALGGQELPVFVTVLQAHPPQGEALVTEVQAVTAAVAVCVGRAEERVHIQYEPAAARRQSFGGKLVP